MLMAHSQPLDNEREILRQNLFSLPNITGPGEQDLGSILCALQADRETTVEFSDV
jgi:hypothetical protein